jgi:hypothetical protein
VTGLLQRLAVFAAVLVALLLVGGGAAPAIAHGSHPHHATAGRYQIAYRSEPSEISGASTRHGAQVHIASKRNLPQGGPDKSGNADCCCGGLMCHAGVTLTVELVSLPDPKGEKVVPEPSSSREQRNPFGLERPPRT